MGLREALEKLARWWGELDTRTDLPENAQWGEGVGQGYRNAATDLRRVLAAHPEPATGVTEQAVEAACKEFYGRWFSSSAATAQEAGRKAMRAALEAAAPYMGVRPVVDREAVRNVFIQFGIDVKMDDPHVGASEMVDRRVNELFALLNGEGSETIR